MRAKLSIALGALVALGWAVPETGTAPFIAAGWNRESCSQRRANAATSAFSHQ